MIHWLGAGLSSTPGIRALAKSGYPLTVWNRTISKAQEAIAPFAHLRNVKSRPFSMQDFTSTLSNGDIVVSMLPATMHPEIAQACLFARSHLVTTSYISEAMKALHEEAAELELSFVNEAGLDPGIDHLFAHKLVSEFREFEQSLNGPVLLKFSSLCGGFPLQPSSFCYKFSWSPLAVLRALKNEARYLRNGELRHAKHPWKDLFSFAYGSEKFEAYPNRDSIPYLTEYGLDSLEKHVRGDDTVVDFMRGTLRPSGWSQTWKEVFDLVEKGSTQELEVLSDKLWKEHAYGKDEADRILLYVALEAIQATDKKPIWSKAYVLDESGKGSESAMAKTVSLTATLAVESILQGIAPIGVSGAPADPKQSSLWLDKLRGYGIRIQKYQEVEKKFQFTERTA
ncbi:MAG: saccharopine dehydrogenase family protein [Bacteriovoracia bacterium]